MNQNEETKTKKPKQKQTKTNKSKRNRDGRCIGKRNKNIKTKIHLEHANSQLLGENGMASYSHFTEKFIRIYGPLGQAGNCISEVESNKKAI